MGNRWAVYHDDDKLDVNCQCMPRQKPVIRRAGGL